MLCSFTTIILFNFIQKSVRVTRSKVSNKCYATLVTAYYKIPSKHSSNSYFKWMKNFLSLKDCIVVYTSEDLVQQIRELRPKEYPLRIIIKPLNMFKVAQFTNDSGWSAQEKMDPEMSIGHSRELYWIWNEKSNLLYESSQSNIFQSQYFAWLDIGAIRHSGYNGEKMMNNFPFQRGILLLQINDFTEEELKTVNNISQVDFSRVNRIGGGMIGGDAEAIKRWTLLFYETLQKYLSSGRFGGKDQSVMATTCIQTNVCLLVKAPHLTNNFGISSTEKDWFYLQQFYRGDVLELPQRLNINNIFYT